VTARLRHEGHEEKHKRRSGGAEMKLLITKAQRHEEAKTEEKHNGGKQRSSFSQGFISGLQKTEIH
jgi:hypothetical protein